MPPTAGEDRRTIDIFRRLQCAERAVEALALLREELWNSGDVGGLIAFEQKEDRLHPIDSVGWDRDVSAVKPLDLTAGSPAAKALTSHCPVPLEELPGLFLPDGKDGWLLPLRDPDSVPFGALVIEGGTEEEAASGYGVLEEIGPLLHRIFDLDRFRKSSEKLERQRDLLSGIINALPDPVFVADANYEMALENKRAEALFTSRDGDSEGRRRAVEINNLLFSSFLSRSELSGGEAPARELNLVDPSEGGDLLFEILSTPLHAPLLGEGSKILILRDVTDLKRAATELQHQFMRVRQAEMKSRRERDRLNLVLENVGDPILVTDDESNIILLNWNAEQLFDVEAEGGRNSSQRQAVWENDTKFSSFISEFAISRDTVSKTEFDLKNPATGEVFPVEVVSGKVMNDRGEMTAIVSIIHDLTKAAENERLASELSLLNESLEDRIAEATTELEERNRQLEWQSRELERAYRLKSEFLASMSHELRTPINALLGYTSLMRDHIYGSLNERQEESLDRMYGASQHLLELVNDILDLAKIEAGKMPVYVDEVDLKMLLKELAQTIEPMIRRKSIELTMDIGSDLPILQTDRTKVKQILLNLLSNAVKFTHEGEVGVRARSLEEEERVEVEIYDTGIGISPEDLDTIFDDFRQIDQSSTREYGGTGLGLSITRKLLKLLGGTIRVESEVGDGTCFFVRFPLSSEEIVLDEEIASLVRSADDALVQEEDPNSRVDTQDHAG